ncbi:uncharacterized protein A4U43_C04F12780 [Asparagus officinalis]|uniref:Uncharacterized protein n=1 Tax=Asparagus officinalis TaxID=4686 RepID=A0A5P1F0E6_ASPOF|nr:uncharacterized protein A4U43_C04F12780 [Asparagus officinalis]
MAKHRNEDSLDEGSLHADDLKQQCRSRVWMRDAMRYHVQWNYNLDLYSFAWAQAVQNKPLGLDVRPEEDEIEYEIDDGDDEIVGENMSGVEGEVEKEEGEIEEGEAYVEKYANPRPLRD